jgi:thioredoxin 1
MIELYKHELEGLLQFNKTTVAIYFYSPFCGTCKLATRMIEVTAGALPHLSIYKCNVNLVPTLISQLEIESVPCLLLLDKDRIVRKVYAMSSVATLYEVLAPFQTKR